MPKLRSGNTRISSTVERRRSQIWRPASRTVAVRGREAICKQQWQAPYVRLLIILGRGFFGRGDMQKEFEDAAFKLQNGQISDVVSTASGLHLIQRYALFSPPHACQCNHLLYWNAPERQYARKKLRELCRTPWLAFHTLSVTASYCCLDRYFDR